MDPKIISDAIRPDILKLLQQGDFEAVFPKIEQKKKGLLGFIKPKTKKGQFVYEILPSCLQLNHKPTDYSTVSKLDFESAFLDDLKELQRILLVLKDYLRAHEIEHLVSLTLLECIRDGATYMKENSHKNPKNSTKVKIWKDADGLRFRAEELANYFKNEGYDQNALDSLYLKATITNTMMNHLPNLVGPDMIAVGQQLEKMGDSKKAKQFFVPVLLDFTNLVQSVEERLNKNKVVVEDIPITESLIQALEGLKRLGDNIHEPTLKNSKELLARLNK